MKEKTRHRARDVQTDAAISAALCVMEAHITALNARDETASRYLHFLHYRLSGGKPGVWEQPGEYPASFRARTTPDWHHSEWDKLDVVEALR